ncbi:hypothetical protein PMAYCL1PPCAC_28922, partial [Pristionchus mayeri]
SAIWEWAISVGWNAPRGSPWIEIESEIDRINLCFEHIPPLLNTPGTLSSTVHPASLPVFRMSELSRERTLRSANAMSAVRILCISAQLASISPRSFREKSK